MCQFFIDVNEFDSISNNLNHVNLNKITLFLLK